MISRSSHLPNKFFSIWICSSRSNFNVASISFFLVTIFSASFTSFFNTSSDKTTGAGPGARGGDVDDGNDDKVF